MTSFFKTTLYVVVTGPPVLEIPQPEHEVRTEKYIGGL